MEIGPLLWWLSYAVSGFRWHGKIADRPRHFNELSSLHLLVRTFQYNESEQVEIALMIGHRSRHGHRFKLVGFFPKRWRVEGSLAVASAIDKARLPHTNAPPSLAACIQYPRYISHRLECEV